MKKRNNIEDDTNFYEEYDPDYEDYTLDGPSAREPHYDEDTYEEHGGLSMGKRLIGVFILLGLLAALLIGGMLLYNANLRPVDPSNTTPEYVSIAEGMLPADVAELLKDSDLVRNSLVFQSYAGRHSYGGAEIQAATYELNRSMSVPEIYTKLVNGDSYVGEMKIVSLPEGLNIREMADLVAQAGICTADEYIAEASNIEKYKPTYPILNSIPVEEIPERTLEGYLYPDTYSVAGIGPEGAGHLVENQLVQFTEKYTPEMLQKTEEAGRTVDDVVIMASLIEMETKLPEDKPIVASVFYNRIAQDMPLQSDITIDYINGTKTPVLTTEQTQVDSPYNTYINLGLPLGPICSPSQSSMEAAIEPAETTYLYFVADMSTGKLYYANTLEEHNQNVATYMQ